MKNYDTPIWNLAEGICVGQTKMHIPYDYFDDISKILSTGEMQFPATKALRVRNAP